MTKQDWANEINKVIANERNEYARSVGAAAFIRESDNALVYFDRKTPRRHARKISLQGLYGLLNGADIRALMALRATR